MARYSARYILTTELAEELKKVADIGGIIIDLDVFKAPNGPPPISGLLVQTGLMDHWSRPV